MSFWVPLPNILDKPYLPNFIAGCAAKPKPIKFAAFCIVKSSSVTKGEAWSIIPVIAPPPAAIPPTSLIPLPTLGKKPKLCVPVLCGKDPKPLPNPASTPFLIPLIPCLALFNASLPPFVLPIASVAAFLLALALAICFAVNLPAANKPLAIAGATINHLL